MSHLPTAALALLKAKRKEKNSAASPRQAETIPQCSSRREEALVTVPRLRDKFYSLLTSAATRLMKLALRRRERHFVLQFVKFAIHAARLD
jgi:hypothetical protein